MNGTTLKALRTLLFFTPPEAADLIGGVTERSWRYWENNGRPVPDDVAEKMTGLAMWRKETIDLNLKWLGKSNTTNLVYYELDDWMEYGKPSLFHKPMCSALAELAAHHGAVLIPFDSEAYLDWLGREFDSDDMRHKWGSL